MLCNAFVSGFYVDERLSDFNGASFSIDAYNKNFERKNIKLEFILKNILCLVL
jgi:hypothetical protein